MTDSYDVAIAGAGPAGAQCARDLAARDYDVVVLEREAEDEFPAQSNKSTAGTFPRMMVPFGIPDDVVMHYTDSVVLESPNDHYRQEQTGAVLDFADFKRFLVEDGRENGAAYRFDAAVNGPITDDGDGPVTGLRYNGDEEVYADIVVDATGPAATVARQLDVVDLQREHQAMALEYELDGIDLDHDNYPDLRDAMMLRLDHEIAPGGYSWIFHTGDDTAKVGLTYMLNDLHRERASGDVNTSIDGYLDAWLDDDPRFAAAERRTDADGNEIQHRGSAHIQLPDQLSAANFMVVGDVAPSIDPVWGEGIHAGMQSARAAAQVADAVLTPTKTGQSDAPDTSADRLSAYDDLWQETVGANRQPRMNLTTLLYMADSDRYDRLMQDLDDMDDNALDALNNGSTLEKRHVIHVSDLPLLAKFGARKIRQRYDKLLDRD